MSAMANAELDRCAAAPPHWRIGRYRFERNPQPIRRWHRWGCSDGACGVANYTSPLTAFFAQRRWARMLPPAGTRAA
jgi:hypothetical protein